MLETIQTDNAPIPPLIWPYTVAALISFGVAVAGFIYSRGASTQDGSITSLLGLSLVAGHCALPFFWKALRLWYRNGNLHKNLKQGGGPCSTATTTWASSPRT